MATLVTPKTSKIGQFCGARLATDSTLGPEVSEQANYSRYRTNVLEQLPGIH